ncbi:SAP30-binding protein isoform X3 [Erinaceus europaeus]|uniref:SAP30-binding protein isoform X3 n=1 Tax=Erinaceus europaeus TaxID=9365 RepID=A0ABM3YCD9_ERIEU|nr:SAP30-binding protein isoform X3 [Erinaceus europaeus]
MAGKKNVLSSLAVYAEDSEPESDGEAGIETAGSAAEEKGGLVSDAYGEDDFSRLGGDEDGYEEEEDENSRQSEDDDSETEKPETDDPKLRFPKESGTCHLMKSRSHLNPLADVQITYNIYEKLIQFCAIDELGTNYPKDMFDPHGWSEDSYYEALAKAQKIEMDKLEKAKKERTKIEFVTGTKKGTATSATATTTTTTASTAAADAQKRKSKWDSAIPVTTIAQPTILTTTATLPAVVTVTTSASGSKTTVISAVGTIVKKAKQ